jgi:hypothetical protein
LIEIHVNNGNFVYHLPPMPSFFRLWNQLISALNEAGGGATLPDFFDKPLCSRKNKKKKCRKIYYFWKHDDWEKKMKVEKYVKNAKRHEKKGMEVEDKHRWSL